MMAALSRGERRRAARLSSEQRLYFGEQCGIATAHLVQAHGPLARRQIRDRKEDVLNPIPSVVRGHHAIRRNRLR
jgi:hypothetical protein